MWELTASIGVFALAIWGLGFAFERVVEIYTERRKLHHEKFIQSHNQMLAERYKALGVNCHGHCYLFGCKYERIEAELRASGIEKDVFESLVEHLHGVNIQKEEPCDTAEQS